MAKSKFYGVRQGHKIGVFSNWEACKKSVVGYAGAEYRSFSTHDDAYEYVHGVRPEVIDTDSSDFNSEENDFDSKTDVVQIYTCGVEVDDMSGYGYIIEVGSTKFKSLSKVALSKPSALIAELSAVVHALEFCIANNILNIEICYFNEGVEQYALGNWSGHFPQAQRYIEVMVKMQAIMNVGFRCIRDSSSNDAGIVRMLAEKGATY